MESKHCTPLAWRAVPVARVSVRVCGVWGAFKFEVLSNSTETVLQTREREHKNREQTAARRVPAAPVRRHSESN
jgi:hypothetical protein